MIIHIKLLMVLVDIHLSLHIVMFINSLQTVKHSWTAHEHSWTWWKLFRTVSYVHVDDLLYTVTCCVLSCTLHTCCATCCVYRMVNNFCGVQIFVGFKMWLFLRILYLLIVNLNWKEFLQFIINVYLHPSCDRLVTKYVCTCSVFHIQHQLVLFFAPLKPKMGNFNR